MANRSDPTEALPSYVGATCAVVGTVLMFIYGPVPALVAFALSACWFIVAYILATPRRS